MIGAHQRLAAGGGTAIERLFRVLNSLAADGGVLADRIVLLGADADCGSLQTELIKPLAP